MYELFEARVTLDDTGPLLDLALSSKGQSREAVKMMFTQNENSYPDKIIRNNLMASVQVAIVTVQLVHFGFEKRRLTLSMSFLSG